jgi:predicted AAA+ superfamily ATPase
LTITRAALLRQVETAIKRSPVTALLGPRQCGKTTLARDIARSRAATFFDLERPADRARLREGERTLGPLTGLIVIDEIQRQPELFNLLRVLADRRPRRARFLILGSASPHLVKGVSETLAGRVSFVDMGGFGLDEVGASQFERLWVRGGFPRSYLARNTAESFAWREDFVRTFLERDIPQLGIQIPAEHLRRFWNMTAHYHAQIWNGSEIAGSLGVGHTTAARYLDLLCGAFVLRRVPPWHVNLGKRLVKSSKVYVRDSGLLHYFLGVHDRHDLLGHPKLGASWEGLVLEELVRVVSERDIHFYSTYSGAECDFVVRSGVDLIGFEAKRSEAPALTRSMHVVLDDLRLKHLFVVYPGADTFPLHEKVTAIPLSDLSKGIATLLRGRPSSA